MGLLNIFTRQKELQGLKESVEGLSDEVKKINNYLQALDQSTASCVACGCLIRTFNAKEDDFCDGDYFCFKCATPAITKQTETPEPVPRDVQIKTEIQELDAEIRAWENYKADNSRFRIHGKTLKNFSQDSMKRFIKENLQFLRKKEKELQAELKAL